MTIFAIDIYSDTICPWCYIGLKDLENAITVYKRTYPDGSSDTFDITWRPYYLNPTASKESIPVEQRLREKNGADREQGIKMRLTRVGKAHGIDFSFAGRLGNTRDSHRLIHLAGTKGSNTQMRVVKELFASHLEGTSDITAATDLTQAAVTAGMDANEVANWLASDNGGPEVDHQAADARASGVNSVPTFQINGTLLEGAQDLSAFYEIFSSLKGETLKQR